MVFKNEILHFGTKEYVFRELKFVRETHISDEDASFLFAYHGTFFSTVKIVFHIFLTNFNIFNKKCKYPFYYLFKKLLPLAAEVLLGTK